MARGVYSGKVSEWSTTSWKLKSSALIGLVPEPSHDLWKGIRSGTRPDGTGGTYTVLTRCGSIRKTFGDWKWHRDGPDVLPIFYRNKSTRILSMVQDFLLLNIGTPRQVDDFPRSLVLLVFARNVDSCRHCWKDWRRHHQRSRIRQPRCSRDDGPFVVSILGAIPSA